MYFFFSVEFYFDTPHPKLSQLLPIAAPSQDSLQLHPRSCSSLRQHTEAAAAQLGAADYPSSLDRY